MFFVCISLMANNIENHARKHLLASPVCVVSDEISIQKLHFYFLIIEYDFKLYFTYKSFITYML